jgi:4-amino-4-deoxy-L-arabinose transferase-like glycosyltransferase
MNKKINISLFLIILLGLFLRLYHLGYYDFWYDEVISFFRAKHIIQIFRYDFFQYQFDPPLFYVLLAPLVEFTRNEFFLRLFPAIIGVITIYFSYRFGKRFFSKKVGLILAFLLSISPFHIYYSQELRAYSLLILITIISYFSFYLYIGERKFKYYIFWILSSLLLLYTHNLAIFLLISQILFLLIEYKKIKSIFNRLLVAILIILIFYLPWIFQLLKEYQFAKATGEFSWVPKISFFTILQTFNIFNAGYNSDKLSLILVSLIYFSLFFIGLYYLKNNLKRNLLLTWIFTPVILLILVSFILPRIYIYRTISYILPAYLLIISISIFSLPKKFILPSLLLITVLQFKPILDYYQNNLYFPQFPYRIGIHKKIKIKEIIKLIERNYKKQDVILHTCRNTIFSFFFYSKVKIPQYIVRYGKIERLYQHKFYKNIGLYPKNIKGIAKKYKRIWLIYSTWEYSYNPDSILKDSKDAVDVKNYLDKIANCKLDIEFDDLRLFLYKL